MAHISEGERRSVVVGAESPLVRAVTSALEERGHDVAQIDLPDVAAHKPDLVRSAFDAAAGDRGVGLVVYVDVPTASTVSTSLSDLDVDGWDKACESVIRRTLLSFQAAHRALDAGGTIVLVVPTMALDGEPGHVPWSAAAEAQRVMAKVAARRWRCCDITVNTVAVPARLLSDAEIGDVEAETAAATAAESVCMLASRDAAELTGATIVADGGALMVP